MSDILVIAPTHGYKRPALFKTIDDDLKINSGLPNDYGISSIVTSGNNIFIGTLGGGVYFSNNGGSKWTENSRGLTSLFVTSLLVSGVYVFAGTKNGVFITGNNGQNWFPVNVGLTNLDVLALIAKDNYIFAGTTTGVFSSINNGGNWVSANNGIYANLSVYCFATLHGRVFAGTHSGVFITTDNGANWTVANTGLQCTDVECFTVDGGYVFVGTHFYGIYVTHNCGITWECSNAGLKNSVNTPEFFNTSVEFPDSIVTAMAIANNNSIFAATSIEGIFNSEDNGTNWHLHSNGILINNIITCFAQYKDLLFAGSNVGNLFVSNNSGLTWALVNTNAIRAHQNLKSMILPGGNPLNVKANTSKIYFDPTVIRKLEENQEKKAETIFFLDDLYERHPMKNISFPDVSRCSNGRFLKGLSQTS